MDADCHIAGGVDRCTDHRATGAGLGYSITGIIAEHFDYRAAFWLAAALILVARIVPHKPNRTSRPLDALGAVLLSALLLCLLLGVSQGHGWGWMSASIVGLFLGFAILLAIWIGHELRVEHPLVDLRLMTNRSVFTADIVAYLMRISLYANSSLVNRFVQAPAEAGYGFQAGLFATGLLLMPLSIGSLVANRVSAVLSNRMNAGTLIAVGSLLVGADMAFLALSRSSRWEIFVSVGILGLGIGIAFAAMSAMIVGPLEVRRASPCSVPTRQSERNFQRIRDTRSRSSLGRRFVWRRLGSVWHSS